MSINETIVAQEEEIKAQIEQAYKRIGELYFATRSADPEPAFEALVSEVKALNEKLDSLTGVADNDAVRKCHVCGTEIEDGYAFCAECGAPVKEMPAPAPMPSPMPAPAPMPSPMPSPMPAPAPAPMPSPMPAPAPAPMPSPMPAPAPVSEPGSFRKFTCSSCGAPIPPGADSCLNCGASAFTDSTAPSVPSFNNYNEDYEVGATTVLSAIQNNDNYDVGATTVLSSVQNNEDYEVGATTVLSAIQNNEDYEVGATTVLSSVHNDEDYEVGATTVLSANFAQPKATFYTRCSCGESIEPGTEFCPKCGARTTKFDVDSIMHDVPHGYVRCTNCGEIVSKSEPYCHSCGFRMGKSRREM